MRDDELQRLVDELLYLVEVGSGSPRADESELAHALDRLALAVRHGVDPGEPSPRPEIPPRDVAVLRKVVGARFPSFGAYNRAAKLTEEIGTARVEVGNALDDLATLADHLHVAAWLWRRHDFDAGCWWLFESHRSHWGEAMRHLQLYLHAREIRGEEERESAEPLELSS